MKITKLLALLSASFLLAGCDKPAQEADKPSGSESSTSESSSSSSESSSSSSSSAEPGQQVTYTIVTNGSNWSNAMTDTPQITNESLRNKLATFLDDGHGLISSVGSTSDKIGGLLYGTNGAAASFSIGGKPSNNYTGKLVLNTSKTLVSISFSFEAYWKTWTENGGGTTYDNEVDFQISGGASTLSDNLHGNATAKDVNYSVNGNSCTLTVTGGRALIKQVSFTYIA